MLKKLFTYSVFRIKDDSLIEKIKIVESIIFILTKIMILVTLLHNYNKNIDKLDSRVNAEFNIKHKDMRKNINKKKIFGIQ